MPIRRNPWLPKDIVQLKQAKIRELNGMMKDISLDYPPDDIGDDWDDIGDATDGLPYIDADGNMIPDY